MRKSDGDLLIGDDLVDQRGLLRLGRALFDEHRVRMLGDKLRHKERQRREHHDEERDAPIEHDHERKRAEDRDDAGEKLREAH